MIFLVTQLTILGVAIFILAAFALIISVRFFLESRKSLEQIYPIKKVAYSHNSRKVLEKVSSINRSHSNSATAFVSNQMHIDSSSDSEELSDLRNMIMQQQQQLTKALGQIDALGAERVLEAEDAKSKKKINQLELQIEKKDAELKKVKQQMELSKKMQVHFNQMQKDFELLQKKLQQLERQAWASNELTIKLENLEQLHLKVEKDIIRKDERLRELTDENQRLHSILNETEDKLREANLQRQQQIKKIQYLEEMADDMKQISESNKKMQNELRRIAELESMLNLITEERNELLKKKKTK
ncbi:MAG TPA: hypothetical protein VM368_09460 [Flavisolibacter sp.]|nr:hypothetical protein [Flavisolibacter sp.]